MLRVSFTKCGLQDLQVCSRNDDYPISLQEGLMECLSSVPFVYLYFMTSEFEYLNITRRALVTRTAAGHEVDRNTAENHQEENRDSNGQY